MNHSNPLDTIKPLFITCLLLALLLFLSSAVCTVGFLLDLLPSKGVLAAGMLLLIGAVVMLAISFSILLTALNKGKHDPKEAD